MYLHKYYRFYHKFWSRLKLLYLPKLNFLSLSFGDLLRRSGSFLDPSIVVFPVRAKLAISYTQTQTYISSILIGFLKLSYESDKVKFVRTLLPRTKINVNVEKKTARKLYNFLRGKKYITRNTAKLV
jgi:hypothetical protein